MELTFPEAQMLMPILDATLKGSELLATKEDFDMETVADFMGVPIENFESVRDFQKELHRNATYLKEKIKKEFGI